MSWQDEYLKEFKRVNGRTAKLLMHADKYLVTDTEDPISAGFNTGIRYSEEQMKKLLANLKTRPDHV